MWMLNFADDSGSADRQGAQPADAPAFDDQAWETRASVGEEINDVMRLMLPWMIAVLVHLGVIVLALFFVWSVLVGEENQEDIIPVARLSQNVAGALDQSQSVDLKTLDKVREVQSEQVPTQDSLANLEIDTTALELTGVLGDSGKMAPFGTTVGGDEFEAKFFGGGGNARKIIYIVDASGSLIDTLPFVIKELKRSINELSDRQEFTVIFFQGGSAEEVKPVGWKPATAENKRLVADFITLESGNIIPRGSTNPVKAIELAMRYRPELVFILSDNITGRGRYEIDRNELLRLLDQANKDRKIKINTIQFLYPDALDTLKTIAEEHGGIYTFVTEADLGLQ